MSIQYSVFSVRQAGGAFCLFALCCAAGAEGIAALCAGRAGIERVYYTHRLGEKPPFEQVSPPALIERLVKEDLRKEAALRKVYGVQVTSALLEAEVQRINATTRAPEVLAEIKAALGNDPGKFANLFAKPILVERLLRDKFDNDDALHAPQRRQMEQIREQLLNARSNSAAQDNETHSTNSEIRKPKPEIGGLVNLLKQLGSNRVSQTIWQLGARPAPIEVAADSDEMEIKKRFGSGAQILSSPAREKDRKFYFEDLPPQLQKVLRVQMREAGDVSAVIETPGGFLLYLAKEKSDAALAVVGLSLPKRNYEQWLEQQNANKL
jgi:hypothetical protein